MIKLQDEDKALIIDAHMLVEEPLEDIRKGVPQTYYVIEVTGDGETWVDDREVFEPVPDRLVGFWRMDGGCDLRHKPVREAIKDYDWFRCEKVERITHTWENLK